MADLLQVRQLSAGYGEAVAKAVNVDLAKVKSAAAALNE